MKDMTKLEPWQWPEEHWRGLDLDEPGRHERCESAKDGDRERVAA
jgi:hypothetical protein